MIPSQNASCISRIKIFILYKTTWSEGNRVKDDPEIERNSDPDTNPVSPLFRLTPPKQSRSRQTLERICSAALDLMEEVGVEAATISDIVDRAGSSVGSFYARFPGKKDLIRYLQDRVWTEARERWDDAMASEAWEGRSMEEVVEAVVGLLLRSFRTDRHRRRILGEDRVSDPETAGLVLDFHDHLIASVGDLLQERRDEMTHPDPDRAIPFGYRAVVGAIREFLEVEEARSAVSGDADAETVEPNLGPELARFWIGYLSPLSTSHRDAGEGAVDFFDPWG